MRNRLSALGDCDDCGRLNGEVGGAAAVLGDLALSHLQERLLDVDGSDVGVSRPDSSEQKLRGTPLRGVVRMGVRALRNSV